jgi:hypothetical protein
MSTIIRELTDIQGVEVSAPTENPFTSSGAEAFASDAAYEVARPSPGVGEFYFNTTYGAMRYHNGTTWQFDKTTFTAQTDSATTGASVDLAPNTTDQIILFTQGALTSIRSISPTNQRYLFLYNGQASNGITLKNEDGTATAANRIVTGTGADFVIQTKQIVTLVYDEDSLRWRLLTRPGMKLESFADDAAYATAHNPPAAGDRYWNTTLLCTREYDGVAWQNNKVLFSTENNTALTGSDQDLSPGRDQIIKLSNASLSSIRGISPSVQGFLILINGTGAALSLKNESSGATAANRIITGTGVDLSMRDGSSILMAYDPNSSRWRVTGGSGSGGSSTSATNCCQSPNDVSIQWSAALQYGWYSSATTAATTTTTAAECPLAPILNTAIKITRTTVGSYDEYRWKMPTALKNNTIPISWMQIAEAAMTSGEYKVDVYTYTDINYTDGTKTRKNLRSDSSSVTSIPAYTGFYGSNNAISFDTGSEDYYGMRITRVSGTKYLSIAQVKIGFDQSGVAAANGEYETVNTFTVGASVTPPTPGTGTTYLRNTYKDGRWAIIRYEIRQTVAGTAGSGDYLLPLPTGLSIDYTRIGAAGSTDNAAIDCGIGTIRNSGTYYQLTGFALNSGVYTNKIYFLFQSDAIGVTTWGSTANSFANTQVVMSITVRVPIVGWDDAVVVGPDTNVEYLSSSFSSYSPVRLATGTALPTTTPAGGSETLTVGTSPWILPQQQGDQVRIEVDISGLGKWVEVGNSYIDTLRFDGTNYIGLGYYWNASGFFIIRGKYASGTNITWATNAPAGTAYRIVKCNPKTPVGIEHGQLHGGAQLYRAGYAAGLTTGAAIGAGYVGEKLTASGSATSIPATSTWYNLRSITLTPGVWLVYANYTFGASVSGTISATVGNIATTSAGASGAVADWSHPSGPNTSVNEVMQLFAYVNILTTTVYYANGLHVFSSGTYSANATMHAVRIA